MKHKRAFLFLSILTLLALTQPAQAKCHLSFNVGAFFNQIFTPEPCFAPVPVAVPVIPAVPAPMYVPVQVPVQREIIRERVIYYPQPIILSQTQKRPLPCECCKLAAAQPNSKQRNGI